MITQWDEKYKLNNEKIDNQHKELFRLVSLVEVLDKKATKTDIKNLLNSFFAYMKEHFKEEEKYMKNIDYPLLKQHRKLHTDIVEEFTKLIKDNHTLDMIKTKMKEASQKWLSDHILENDLKIKKWLDLNK
ncbi:MAG: bacteriohemerythrin [Sulfurospirillaceae bacterium]|nr:bacteriohemerythrin [Sulfurospirillaceae bacterium]